MNPTLFNALVAVWLVLAAATFTVLFFVAAPYGRHSRAGWGASIASRWGWLLMEAPSALVFGAAFVFGKAPQTVTAWAFLLMWESHYVHRAFIYPFTRRDAAKRMPLAIMFMGLFFNLINAGSNGYAVFTLSGGYAESWLRDPRFIVGSSLFIVGYFVNRWADQKLRALRASGDSSYKIPQGGLYRYVSNPNYLGEILEWCGWAVATWSLAGAAFAMWTIANLAPRARANHLWYRRTFPDYPTDRKILAPGIW